MDSWIVPACSLKNKEVFWIGLVDRPRVEPYKQGAVPNWPHGSSLHGALKQGGLPDWPRASSPRSVLDGPCIEP